jgi:hypothetical protein
MNRIYWSVIPLTTVFILWGFVVWGSESGTKPSENSQSSVFFPFDIKNVNDIAGTESRKQNVYLHDNEIRVPEVKTLKAAHVSGSEATLEGRIEKFEYIDGPKPIRTGNKEFRGGVLVKDGRIVLVPRTGKFVCEYDPATNTIVQTAEHGQEGGFGMGVVLDDGYTVIMTPRGSRNVGIYDARTQTYRDGAAHGRSSDNAFLGCVKISPELIVFGPLHSKVVGLYNPKTDTYTDGPAHNEAETYNFSIITRSSRTGNVIFTPFYSKHVGVYDPNKNTYTSGAAHQANVLSAYSGSVELENGHILMAPRNASHVGIYDPVTDTFMKGPEHGEGKGAFMEAERMPDGEIIMAAFRSNHIGIYEPSTGEYRSGPSVAHVPGVGIGRFSSTVLTQSEDMIVMTNRDADVIGLVRINQFFSKGNQAEVFFRYRKKGETSWQRTGINKINKPGVFKININKLAPNNEYEFKSAIRFKNIELEGNICTFKTNY